MVRVTNALKKLQTRDGDYLALGGTRQSKGYLVVYEGPTLKNCAKITTFDSESSGEPLAAAETFFAAVLERLQKEIR